MQQYQGLCKIIAIWMINNFSAYRIFIACIAISSNNYKYQTTNNFEKLLTQKDNENTTIITTLILISISMHIGPTWFLEDGILKLVYDIDRKI